MWPFISANKKFSWIRILKILQKSILSDLNLQYRSIYAVSKLLAYFSFASALKKQRKYSVKNSLSKKNVPIYDDKYTLNTN